MFQFILFFSHEQSYYGNQKDQNNFIDLFIIKQYGINCQLINLHAI